MRLPLADVIDHPWWKAYKVPDSVYKTFRGGDLGSICRFLFRRGSGKARRMRRRSVTVGLGLRHAGPLGLCLAGRRWCEERG